MKKGLKITVWILALLAVLLLAGLVAIQSPVVQTAVGKRIVERIQKGTDATIRFKDISGARFIANRYRNGFEAAAVCLNDDAMHKPAWDKPVVFSYAVRMER